MLFLLSQADGLDVKRLIEIYEARQVADQVVRNALVRLKKDGYIDSPERSMYRITDRGLDFMTTINKKPILLDKRWDGQWLTVMFEVPESERKKRDALRSDLLQLGLGALYKSVYITPWDYAEEVLRFAEQYDLGSCMTLLRGAFIHQSPTQLRAKQLWPMDELNAIYRDRMDWFRSAFVPAVDRMLDEPADDALAIFIRFLELGELLADLSLRDPMLPEELLEENWLGRTCFREMQHYLKKLAIAIPSHSPYRDFVTGFL